MTTIDEMRQLALIQDAVLTRQAERSLRAFVAQAWLVLEPSTPFLPNWHIDCLCEHLEAVTAGHLPRLVINLPPRYMKSLLVSVCWPAWEWLRAPETRWVFASYSESLANRPLRQPTPTPAVAVVSGRLGGSGPPDVGSE